MKEIKACPFCGSTDPELYRHKENCYLRLAFYAASNPPEIGVLDRAYDIRTPDPWDHISPEYREGVTYTLHVDKSGNWYIKNDLLKGTSAARGEMGDPDRDGESKTVRQGVWV